MIRLGSDAVNAAVDAVGRLADGGWLDIYEGAQPAQSGGDLPSGSRLLASLQFGTPAFMPARDGAAKSHPVLPDTDAAQTGRPGWFRIYRADHATPVYDGEASRDPDADLVMRVLVIAQHSHVSIDSCRINMPRSLAAAAEGR